MASDLIFRPPTIFVRAPDAAGRTSCRRCRRRRRRVCREGGDDRLRLLDLRGGRREHLVDHRHLRRMDGEPAGEAVAPRASVSWRSTSALRKSTWMVSIAGSFAAAAPRGRRRGRGDRARSARRPRRGWLPRRARPTDPPAPRSCRSGGACIAVRAGGETGRRPIPRSAPES